MNLHSLIRALAVVVNTLAVAHLETSRADAYQFLWKPIELVIFKGGRYRTCDTQGGEVPPPAPLDLHMPF